MPTNSRNRQSPKRLARRMKPTRHLSRRKGSGKKGSARARNPKKMRGGVRYGASSGAGLSPDQRFPHERTPHAADLR